MSTLTRIRLRPAGRITAPTTVALLAALVGGTLVGAAFSGRGVGEARVPVAVVNNDVIVTTGEGKDEQTIAAGREVAGDLIEPEPAGTSLLDFTLTDESRARSGLEDGDFYAMVVIPESFSDDVSKLGTDDPVTAQVQLETNGVNGRLVAAVSERVTAATAAFGHDLTVQYLDNSLQAQDLLSDGLGEAAEGADDIAEGAASLSVSSEDLAGGADSLAQGAGELSSSTEQLESGAAVVSSGAADLSSGADDLVGGADRLAAGTQQVSKASRQVAGGAGDLAAALEGLSVAAKEVDAAAQTVSSAATQTSEGLATVQPVAEGLADGSAQLVLALNQLAQSCPPTAGPYCDRVEAAVPAAETIAQQSAAVSHGLGSLGSGAEELSEGASQLATATESLSDGVAAADDAGTALADASASSASAAADVASGAEQLSASSAQLATGASDLAAGSEDLLIGTSAVANGADQTGAGAADLADGADSLSDGANDLTEPTEELAASLDETADEIPTYDEDERKQVTRVVAEPVTTATQDLFPERDPTATPLPLAVLIALLCLTAAAFAVRPPLPTWALQNGGATNRIIVTGLRPALGAVSLAATATLLLPVWFDVARPLSLAILTAAGGITLLAAYQAISAFAPRRGPLIGALLLLVQLIAVPWGLPIELAPDWIQSLHQVLPVPVLLDGLNVAIVGADRSSVGVAVFTLVAWTGASILLTRLAISRTYRRSQGVSLWSGSEVSTTRTLATHRPDE